MENTNLPQFSFTFVVVQESVVKEMYMTVYLTLVRMEAAA